MQLKQSSLIKISDTFMHEKNPQENLSSLAAILDAILYQGFTNNKVTFWDFLYLEQLELMQ